jgi:hypothetical protein
LKQGSGDGDTNGIGGMGIFWQSNGLMKVVREPLGDLRLGGMASACEGLLEAGRRDHLQRRPALHPQNRPADPL